MDENRDENRREEMCHRIKSSAQVPVPERLKPEQIEKMLEEDKFQSKGKRSRSAAVKTRRMVCGVAAVVAVAVVGGSVLRTTIFRKEPKGPDPDTVVYTANLGIDGLCQAESYEQVYKMMEDVLQVKNDWSFGGFTKGEMIEDTAIAESAQGGEFSNVSTGTQSSSQEEHSVTNIQEEGVGEADVALTDGRYLYVKSIQYSDRTGGEDESGKKQKTAAYIVEPDNETGRMTKVGKIDIEYELDLREMYLSDDRLICICTDYGKKTAVKTYDVSNPEKPELLGNVEMSGSYHDSRLVDGYVYTFTYMYPECVVFDHAMEEPEGFIPCVQGEVLPVENIYLPDIEKACNYFVAISIDVQKPDQVADKMSIVMDSADVYVSQKYIFATECSYDELGGMTLINKFSYDQGKMEPVAGGKVNGRINNTFSMDEYNGYLRVVTTTDERKQVKDQEEYTTLNHLFVLDENLQKVSSIDNLAEGETIYSARFMGDVGYFVTYRQVDPLFSVDLSDPLHPVVLGELKISGFSEYLHPYGEGKLLGIGWETTYYPDMDIVKRDGMKLSMFDVTDLGKVQEQDKVVEENVDDMLVGEDHKAVLVSARKNLIGIGYAGTVNNVAGIYYVTYRYVEGEGFQVVTTTRLGKDVSLWLVRGMYIGDKLYVSDGKQIQAVSLENGQVLDTLKLNR